MNGSGDGYCDGLRQFLLELRRRLPNTDPRDVEEINKIYANISKTERELDKRCGGVTPPPPAPPPPPPAPPPPPPAPPPTLDADQYCARLRAQLWQAQTSGAGQASINRLQRQLESQCGGVGTTPQPANAGSSGAGSTLPLPRNQPWKPKMLSQGDASPIAPPAYSGPAGPRKQRPFGGAGFKPY